MPRLLSNITLKIGRCFRLRHNKHYYKRTFKYGRHRKAHSTDETSDSDATSVNGDTEARHVLKHRRRERLRRRHKMPMITKAIMTLLPDMGFFPPTSKDGMMSDLYEIAQEIAEENEKRASKDAEDDAKEAEEATSEIRTEKSGDEEKEEEEEEEEEES
eukprot:g3142.t1